MSDDYGTQEELEALIERGEMSADDLGVPMLTFHADGDADAEMVPATWLNRPRAVKGAP